MGNWIHSVAHSAKFKQNAISKTIELISNPKNGEKILELTFIVDWSQSKVYTKRKLNYIITLWDHSSIG